MNKLTIDADEKFIFGSAVNVKYRLTKCTPFTEIWCQFEFPLNIFTEESKSLSTLPFIYHFSIPRHFIAFHLNNRASCKKYQQILKNFRTRTMSVTVYTAV